MKLEVLYEDNHIIAINKPSGYLVQGDKSRDETLADEVKAYIKVKYKKPGDVFLGISHRLDRPTSGVVLFARTSKALVRLNKMFKDAEIQKTYWAVVENIPEEIKGKLVHYLVKNEEKNKSRAVAEGKSGSKRAELSYEWIIGSDNYHLLEVKPKTGRHHQIRVQLATQKSFIKGDVKYGAKRTNPTGSIHLHARKVEFIHPVKKEPMTITAKADKEDPVWRWFEQNV